MKTKLVLMVILTSFFIFVGCSDNEDDVQESGLVTNLSKSSTNFEKSSAIDNQFPQAQDEVLKTFGAIAQSITAGAGNGANSMYMDQLISFHAYGPKFTEFNDGQAFDSAGNEANERTFFGEIVDPGGVVQFAPMEGSLKVAVYYGNVANLTFISDFHLMINGELHIVNNLISLLFVKVKGEWKMVHEHHSPFNE
ncbi:MAG: SnoaL-like domain-containing protein [Flavobacteriaceae bacterium]|nr:nuclear transport factor 2 family protein [Bacteroidia bacterium]MBT8288256.1 nuclear transport factor 2 family protein [Bacteroidia bacterium]NNF74800.1 SnoaL-like domain-containing protein [Flavobacteriaceae bacterium]NNK74169.1 SnoaL-like domain-containing protein [Flavobacteriaceae bacterium]